MSYRVIWCVVLCLAWDLLPGTVPGRAADPPTRTYEHRLTNWCITKPRSVWQGDGGAQSVIELIELRADRASRSGKAGDLR